MRSVDEIAAVFARAQVEYVLIGGHAVQRPP
jgi:hypothetical protein